MAEKSVEVLSPDPGESATESRNTGPVTDTERDLAEVLADVICIERVSVDSHFFVDLGTNSMAVAHFCPPVRKRVDLPSASMEDIYRHPTIRSLATALGDVGPAPGEVAVPEPAQEVAPGGTPRCVGNPLYVLYLRAVGDPLADGAGKRRLVLRPRSEVRPGLLDLGQVVTESVQAVHDGGAVAEEPHEELTGSEARCQSQEDGTFTSGRSAVGEGCSLGVGAHVHYGVTVGDGADSFLMKGEEVPRRARWGGNPASELETPSAGRRHNRTVEWR